MEFVRVTSLRIWNNFVLFNNFTIWSFSIQLEKVSLVFQFQNLYDLALKGDLRHAKWNFSLKLYKRLLVKCVEYARLRNFVFLSIWKLAWSFSPSRLRFLCGFDGIPDVFSVWLSDQRDHLSGRVLDGLAIHTVRTLLATAVIKSKEVIFTYYNSGVSGLQKMSWITFSSKWSSKEGLNYVNRE